MNRRLHLPCLDSSSKLEVYRNFIHKFEFKKNGISQLLHTQVIIVADCGYSSILPHAPSINVVLIHFINLTWIFFYIDNQLPLYSCTL